MTRVLITGGAGFIGSHLVRRLLSDEADVHLIVRPEQGTGRCLDRLTDIENRVTLHRIQLGDRTALDCVFQQAQPDWVFHLAVKTRWQALTGMDDALGSIEQDLIHLMLLLDAARQCPPRVFIRVGSLAEYGDGPVPYCESQREQPITAYGASLVAGTHYIHMLRNRLPFPVVTPRLALTYGQGQARDFLVPALLEACLSGRPMHVRHPSERRDLIHVDDVVDALMILAVTAPPSGTVVNIATGKAPTMEELARLIQQATSAPRDLITFGPHDAHGPVPHLCGSPQLARKLMGGWSARLSLTEGIHRTVEMCRASSLHSC